MGPVVNPANSELAPAKTKAPRRLSRLSFWLFLMAMGLLFFPLYLVNSTITEAAAIAAADLSDTQQALSVVPEPNAEETTLRQTVTQLEAEKAQLEQLGTNLEGTSINWPSIMATIGTYDPSQIEVTGLTQENQRLTIVGIAHNEQAISAYADMLRAAPLFQDVTIQLISLETTPASEEQAAFTVSRFTLVADIATGMQ